MIRSLLVLFAVGLVGMAALGIVLGVLMPLLVIALKIGFVLVVGYFLLKLISPSKAEELRSRMRVER